MVEKLRQRLVKIAPIAFILAWLISMGTWILLDRKPLEPWQEILAYSFILPILIASFFYGRLGGMLTALASSFITGALAIGQPGLWQSPLVERLLAQIVFFNIVALVTSSLTEREREAKSRYRELFDSLPVGLYRTTPDGKIIDANTALAQLLGYPDRGALLAAHVNAVDFYTNAEARQQLRNAIERDGLIHGSLLQLQQRGGKRIWVLDSGRASRNRGGQGLHYDGSLQDVTERKRAEDSEREQRTQAEALRDAAAALNSTLNFDEVLDRILANVSRVVPCDTANIMLCEGNMARVTRSRGYAQHQLEEEVQKLRMDITQVAALRQMAETRQPLLIPETRGFAGWADLPATHWIRTYIGAPICVKGEVIGFINLDSATPGFFTPDHAAPLRAFADQAAVALENARLLAEAERRVEQMQLLYEAGLALNSVLEPHALLEFLFKTAMQVLRAERAEFFRHIPAQKDLCLELAVGFSSPIQDALSYIHFPVSESTVNGWVAVHRQPLYLPDVSAHPRYQAIDPAIRSGLWAPVEHEHQLRGVLAVFSLRPRAFTPQDEQMLTLFANQAAVALENARLFDEIRQRLEELEAVNQLSIALRAAQTLDEMLPRLLDQILAQFRTSVGAIWLHDGVRHQLRPAAGRGWLAESDNWRAMVGDDIASAVFRTGQAYITPEFARDQQLRETYRRCLPGGWGGACVPLHAAQENIGALCISAPLPREFTPSEIHLLDILAGIAGSALQRVNLHMQTEQRLRRLAALREIDTAISGSLDLRVTLNVLLDQVTAQLEVEAADVLLLKPDIQVLYYAAGRGFRSPAMANSRVRLGEGLAGRCVLERRTLSAASSSNILKDSGRTGLAAGDVFQAYFAAPLLAKGQIMGVLEIFHPTLLLPNAEWLDFLDTLAGQAAIAIDNTMLFDNLQRSNTELLLAYDATLEGWSHALDLRDKETEGHSQRVTEIAVALARRLGIDDAGLTQVWRGALLHDIGKMGVPDSILLKQGPLSPEERAIMSKHSDYAYDMLAPIVFLRPALDIPYCHHEKWDGTGYPRGLAGEQIPLAARVFAIVDVWDALCSDRPYRAAWPKEKVRRYIREQSGYYFDPHVAEAFLEMGV